MQAAFGSAGESEERVFRAHTGRHLQRGYKFLRPDAAFTSGNQSPGDLIVPSMHGDRGGFIFRELLFRK